MAIEAAMALTNRLLASAQALAALTAYMRATAEGRSLDPDLQDAIDRVIETLDARDAIDGLSESDRHVVAAFARSYLRQAMELAEEPFRASSWTHSDPTILQAQGAASGVVARLVREAGLGSSAMRVLDIGTGVGGLAIAFCEAFPEATVVGLDPWEPSLSLARENVSRAGMHNRIALHQVTIEDFEDGEGFDLIWLPSFFIPRRVIGEAARKCIDLLRPTGQLVVGVVEGPDDPVAGAVDAMITIRSGGSVLEPGDAAALLSSAGFAEVAEVRRTWKAPLRLVSGRRFPADDSASARRSASAEA